MLALILMAQAGLFQPPAPEPKWTVYNVDRITVNLIITQCEHTDTEFRQCYVSFWNRSRYLAATGAAFPLWENRGWRVWTPECGPFRSTVNWLSTGDELTGDGIGWVALFEPEMLIVEGREYVFWISSYDVESQWPACIWRNQIK